MKNIFKFSAFTAIAAAMLSLASCQTKELGTDQYAGDGIVFSAMAPNPVVRGAELRIKGANLEQVKEVRFTGGASVTAIQVIATGQKSEILIVVPQEGTEVGRITLVDASGNTSASKFDLEFDESDLVFEGFDADEEVLPGDVITIYGDYVNTVQEVIFATSQTNDVGLGAGLTCALASEGKIFDQTRTSAKVIVPADAITGIIKICSVDQIADPSAIASPFPGTDTLFVGKPTVNVAETQKAGVGDILVFTGEHLDMIEGITFEGGATTDILEVNEAADTLRTILISKAVSGDVILTSYAGDEFVAGDIEAQVPGNLEVIAANEEERFKAGLMMAITGEQLWLVSKISLNGLEISDFTYTVGTDDETLAVRIDTLYAEIPETATDGIVSVLMENGDEVSIDNIEYVKAVTDPLAIESVEARTEFSVTGADLDLVTGITLGDIECEFTFPIIGTIEIEDPETGDPIEVEVYSTEEIIVTAAPTAVSGDLVLTQANGYSFSAGSLEVTYNEPVTINYESSSIQLGQNLVVTGENLFSIAKIFIKGKLVTSFAERSDTRMSFAMPDGMGPGVYRLELVLLDDTTLTWAVPFEYTAPYTEKFAWEGSLYLDNWTTQEYLGAEGALAELGAVEGDIVRIYFTPEKEGWGFQLYDGHWSGLYVDELGGGNMVDASAYSGQGYFAFELTSALLDQLNSIQGWGGLFVTNGDGVTYTGISLIHWGASEKVTTIWEGSVSMGAWANSMGALSWGGYDWSTVSVGTILRVEFTVDETEADLRFGNGSWSALPSSIQYGKDTDGNIIVDGLTKFELELTQADLDQLVNNGGLVMCGCNYTITSVSLVEAAAPVVSETEIWTGSVSMGAWANSMGALSWGGYDWSTVSVGTILRVKFTVDEKEADLRFGNGSWSALPSSIQYGKDSDGNIIVDDLTQFDLELTQADLDELVNNGGLVMCGCNYTLISVSLVG